MTHQLQPEAPINASIKRESSAQDFFLHLLAMIALYIGAVSFLTVVFQMVNIFFFDTLEFGSLYGFYDKMRFSLAAIIVVFPVYVGTTRYLTKAYKLHPEKRNIAIRRWLVNFTLFVAALIIIGDTIALLRSLLSGETTLRFFLKALAVLFVAGSIMNYYIWPASLPPSSQDYSGHSKTSARKELLFRCFTSSVIGVVVLVIIGGILQVGSPKEERLRRFDDQRVSHLQEIQSHVISYWQSKGSLPKTLNSLQDSTRGVFVPHDPQSGEAYEYKITGDVSFELCGNFARKSFAQKLSPMPKRPPMDYPYPVGATPSEQSWQHGEGRTCFERKIDKDFFKPLKQEKPETPKKGL